MYPHVTDFYRRLHITLSQENPIFYFFFHKTSKITLLTIVAIFLIVINVSPRSTHQTHKI